MKLRGLVTAALAATVTLVNPDPLDAQQFSVSAADGVVLHLPGGRLAVLQAEEGRIVVRSVVDGQGTSTSDVDLAVGDRITRFLQATHPTLEEIRTRFASLAVGADVTLGVVRGASPERVVQFPKPAPGPGRALAVSGAAGGAGAWMAGTEEGAREVMLAGAHIRENNEGLPEVTHRTSHPAASTVALRVGDVITTVNGRPLAALAGLERLLSEVKAGDPVTLVVTRGGQTVTVTFPRPGQ